MQHHKLKQQYRPDDTPKRMGMPAEALADPRLPSMMNEHTHQRLNRHSQDAMRAAHSLI